jgi:hypothetical protein
MVTKQLLNDLGLSDDIQAISLLVFIVAGLSVANNSVVALIAVLAFLGLIPKQFRRIVSTVLIGGFILNFAIGYMILPWFSTYFPGIPDWAVTAKLAGFTEPMTTKFIPSIILLWWCRNNVPDSIGYIRGNSWELGGLLGLSFGIMEALLKVSDATGNYSTVNAVTEPVFLAISLHFLTGMLVAGTVFQWWARETKPSRKQSFLLQLKVISSYTIAAIIHVWWNSGGVAVVLGRFGF